ncbi:NADPH-dependent FMN reductase [Epibacterium sp. SM1969]|uniref:NADPH-dependent FMN reductase n=1 Tax=Tritonibacter aquimaris TaxID=2663379 RepID=A0A844AQ53_9RHOB|nr:flavodoxin family protein [Tritonibacter aquimaris]MQY41068.1 NADPH-dependent FMN reductase [Tritonibacter aquimaris]
MARIEIIYFSGYGHTAKQAQAVLDGAQSKADARLWAVPDDGVVSDALWAAADAADALIFGAPTYMGGVPWQFKRFIDASSGRWQERKWASKITGGFTNSASAVGDKGETMNYLRTFTGQHGMLWVPLNQAPANMLNSGPDDRNFAGGSSGALAISPADARPDQAPGKGDLQSAHDYGAYIAGIAQLHAAR